MVSGELLVCFGALVVCLGAQWYATGALVEQYWCTCGEQNKVTSLIKRKIDLGTTNYMMKNLLLLFPYHKIAIQLK